MRFYKDTNGVWLCNNRVAISGTLDAAFHGTDVVIKKLGQDSVDAEYYRGPITNIEKETAPGAGTFISVIDKADFLLTYKDFFVNPLNPLKEDVEGLQEDVEQLQIDVSAIQGGYLGTLLHTDAAPEPGVSGIYKFISAGVVSWLSGTPTVAVEDEVSVVFTDPTYTYTYIQSTTNAQLALKVAYTDSLKYYPVINYANRVLADSGVISDLEKLTKLYIENLKLLDNTIFLWDGSAGVKTRTSGVNQYATKLYDMSSGNRDATQTTEANQPFVVGGIAPSERIRLKNNSLVKALSHSTINISSVGTNGFSITTVLKPTFNKLGTSANQGRYVMGSVELYFNNTGTLIIYSAGTGSLSVGNNLTNLLRRGSSIVTWVADAYGLRCYVNGVQYAITGTYTPFSGTITGMLNTGSDAAFDGEIYHHQIFNKALSASEVQAQHAYLRLQHPEIEGINIGNQHWATSNYEGVVTGDGTVIPEIQAAENVEKITNVADREFTSDTGFWVISNATIANGVCNIKSVDGVVGSYISKALGFLTIGKLYKISYSISRKESGNLKSDAGFGSGVPLPSNIGANVFYGVATATAFSIVRAGITDIDLDTISIEEVGWANLQAAYDGLIAQGQTVAQATQACAAWCYYNNDPLNGAVYGKMYNKEAREILNQNAPAGYRFASDADYTQLINYLGGSAVAGGKVKKEGLIYWLTPNTGATNESGYSAISGGVRLDDGTFVNKTTSMYLGTEIGGRVLSYNTTSFVTAFVWTSNPRRGTYLRLIRNEPVGATERTIETGYITNALGATNLDISIPFGYQVESVRIDSETNITGLSAKLLTGALVELETLFTAKSVTTNVQKVIAADADQSIQQTDAVVRINGTKADTTKRFRVWIKLTKVVFS